MQYNFEWDPVKAKENLKKHGVSFEESSEIFLDPLQLSLFDDEHSYVGWAKGLYPVPIKFKTEKMGTSSLLCPSYMLIFGNKK